MPRLLGIVPLRGEWGSCLTTRWSGAVLFYVLFVSVPVLGESVPQLSCSDFRKMPGRTLLHPCGSDQNEWVSVVPPLNFRSFRPDPTALERCLCPRPRGQGVPGNQDPVPGSRGPRGGSLSGNTSIILCNRNNGYLDQPYDKCCPDSRPEATKNQNTKKCKT